MKKNVYILVSFLLLFLVSTFVSVASEPKTSIIESEYYNTTIITSDDDSIHNISIGSNPLQRIPNVWSVQAAVSGQNDRITISGHNVGIDKIDKISCNVKVTDTFGRVQFDKLVTFTDIKPLISQTYKLTVKNWNKIEITNIQAWDGSDHDTHPDHTILRII